MSVRYRCWIHLGASDTAAFPGIDLYTRMRCDESSASTATAAAETTVVMMQPTTTAPTTQQTTEQTTEATTTTPPTSTPPASTSMQAQSNDVNRRRINRCLYIISTISLSLSFQHSVLILLTLHPMPTATELLVEMRAWMVVSSCALVIQLVLDMIGIADHLLTAD